MKKLLYSSVIIGIIGLFSACEDTVDLDIPDGKVYPVVDAWLTNTPGAQAIRISETVPYTSADPAPNIADAQVIVTDLSTSATYEFLYDNGKYWHDPGANNSIITLGHIYKLSITLDGELFEATDTVKRVPPIDSITYEFKTEEESISNKEGYYARFWGRDIAGDMPDYYWVSGYRNNMDRKLTNVFAIDASFEAGLADSAIFIQPISEGITDYDKPYQKDETIIARLASLSKPSYDFLTHVDAQVNNGGLFATILENVGTNLKNSDAGSTKKVLGWFGVSAVSIKQKLVE
ncbi:hypothetical protein COR50_20915 [Chitinophaga caeni]|uniref:DUF4249 domain-containing protein n=1 Tax=Chitinophaga caeni TaxID=2029983 RepID=A0A291QZR7_9BACT|nr:DUF4249 domain-containing protein [Chitinophaga caeni]ATL49438.1 hypothetical protein COR50_20915 [Chitinophaga caeni]